MNALPLSYTASSYTVARKVSYEKVFSPKLGESYRPESNRTLLIRNQLLYHLSYDSISRFLKSFNHFKLMGIKTNLKGNGIFTAHRART